MKKKHRALIKFLTKYSRREAIVLRGFRPGKTCFICSLALFSKTRNLAERREDDALPGRSIEVTNMKHRKTRKIIMEDAQLKKKQHTEMVGVSDRIS